jgi:hypothetical protein
MQRLNGTRAESAQALIVEYAITQDAPDGTQWPPPEGDGWVLVCRRQTEHATVWRRLYPKT